MSTTSNPPDAPAAVAECGACFEPITAERPAVTLGNFRTVNGDELRPQENCSSQDHLFCKECYSAYLTTRINDRMTSLRCPAAGCTTLLFAPDVRKLVEGPVFDRYMELCTTDYSKKRGSILDGCDFDELLELTRVYARICPHCGVLVQRSQGCNSMWCICGSHFSYQEAERLVDHDPDRLAKLVDLAKAAQLTPQELLKFECDYAVLIRAIRYANLMGSSASECLELAKAARTGDAEARARIHALRQDRRTCEGEEINVFDFSEPTLPFVLSS